MNKTFQINLGGSQFSIDDDAYEFINKYLISLRRHFAQSESCEEILSDIESRMAELFQEVLNGRTIIGLKDVEEVIAIMGKPEDFGAEPIEKEPSSAGQAGFTPGKRLYRDPDDKKLGGVCSGMSAYLGIEDPLWLRLAFVVLFFTWGLGFITYLVLWLLIPKASTSAEKLAMRGKPATFENIARVVEDDINDLGSKVKENIKSGQNDGLMGFLGGFVNAIATVLGALVGIFIKFFKAILLVMAVLIAFSLAASWVATIIGVSVAFPVLYNLGPTEPGLTTAGIIASFVAWLLALVTAGVVAGKTIKEFQSYSEATTSSDHRLIGNQVIIDVPDYEDEERDFGVFLGNVQLDGETLKIEDIELNVEQSQDSLLHISREVSARGQSREEAGQRASRILHSYEVTDSTIRLDPFLEIPQTDKYRGQKIEYTLYIPEGKTIVYQGRSRHLKMKGRHSTEKGRIHLDINEIPMDLDNIH
ncbi:MAG: PspC domain-containing protein [Saprospiraceae bacterium]|nr:PspC domain-containing protein [Saprospiraceae bacterium]